MKMMLSFLFLLCASHLSAQTDEIIHLWPDSVPGEKNPKAPPKFKDNNDIDDPHISEVTDPLLVVFRPEPSKRNGAAVVVCPGGGYWVLAVKKEGYEIAEWLTAQGFTAFVLQYRVPLKRAGALMDVQRALRLVRASKEQYGILENKIGVMGFSAGASLSARAATRYRETTYPAIDGNDSLSCRPDFALLIYPAYLDKGENHSLTPELKVDDKTPPAFLFATADDKYSNSALVMTGALRDAKVPVELHMLPLGGHGYGMRPGKEAAEVWPELARHWLARIVQNPE